MKIRHIRDWHWFRIAATATILTVVIYICAVLITSPAGPAGPMGG